MTIFRGWATRAEARLSLLLDEAAKRANTKGSPTLASFSQPLPVDVEPLAVFAGRRTRAAFWGQPESGFWLVGMGGAAISSANGMQAMDEVAEGRRSLLRDALVDGASEAGSGPIFMGGFRYDALAPKSNIWRSFPDARLALPAVNLVWQGGAVTLTVNLLVPPGADVEGLARQRLDQVIDLRLGEVSEGQSGLESRAQSPDSGQWNTWVERALEAMREGPLTKVVLARRKTLCGRSPFSADAALSRLITSHPSCTVFAFDNGDSCFLGATPETLVGVRGGTMRLRCLAGTVGRSESPEEDEALRKRLLESHKERQEHQAVVSMVAKTLRGVCNDLCWDQEPKVIKLKTVQHLATSFSGHLNGGGDILRLVQLLHPTPAVGGVPSEVALKMIREMEGDRGWYAAPVGWLDAKGDGEFSIAIRSALLRGREATLFAGSGIVKGSRPERELAETELKFLPLLAALTDE